MKKIFSKKTETTIVEKTTATVGSSDEKHMNDIAPKKVGRLDMVIAFDSFPVCSRTTMTCVWV